MLDLNTMLANAAVGYRNKARQREQDARDELARLDENHGYLPGRSEMIEAKAARCREEAGFWRRMEAAAREGLHLMESNPFGPGVELYPEVRAEAIAQGRTIATWPAAELVLNP